MKEEIQDLGKVAVLADLTMTGFGVNKHDKEASDELTTRKHADETSARVIKKLLTDAGPLHYTQRKMLKMFYSLTVPWTKGVRMLPVANMEKLNKTHEELSQELKDKLIDFKPKYQEAVFVKAKASLGDLWDENDYLSFDEFAAKWSIQIDYFPVPNSGHFVIEANKKLLAEVRKNLVGSISDRYGNISKDLWKRLAEAVKTIVDRLSADRMRFQEDKAVMSGLRDLISLLPVLNISGDKALTETLGEVNLKVASISDTDLQNDKTKTKVAKVAEKLLEQINTYIDTPLKRDIQF